MTRNMRLLASASVLAATAVAASPAFAAGTTAGTTVTNSVTLDYKIGGIDQAQLTASNQFTVDRKVNLTVTETGNSATTVTPGQTAAVTTFSVSNSSNAPLDFALAASQLDGGTAPHGATDNFDVSGVKIYVDTNTNGSYDPGTDLEASYLDQVAADTSRTVFIVANVPIGRATGDAAGVRLKATAAEATAAGSLGATVTQTPGANTNEMDTVFADTDSNGNVARDGMHFAVDDYVILAARLTATKTSRVISDPFNGTTDPKMIPGAVVEYCIAVANASGSATADGVTISDDVPDETTYDAAFGILLNGTVTGSTCNPDGGSGGSYTNGIVSGTLSGIAAGVTRTLVFRVSVN
ncbi:MAG TPA: hypothetical protein VFQ67_08685 [Allosphingosinicella sp.]|jgi:hypothetical protein|nr:hypothetical protein [Allosphingosinicella sp.]